MNPLTPRPPTGIRPLEGYQARERRAASVKGGTDAVPVPSWMTCNFDHYNQGATNGRCGCEWAGTLHWGWLAA